MRTFTKSIGASLLTMVVALGAPTIISAELIRTPFAGMPEAKANNLDSQEWFNKLNDRVSTQKLPLHAGEAPSDFRPLWSTDMTMADSEAECDASQMRLLADGGYIAVYTCGGGEKILEGRIVRLSATGDKLWETVLQYEMNTTANKVCQGEDGRFYVLGSTLYDGSTQSYLACIDDDGKQVYMTINEDNVATVKPIEVATVGNNTAIVYSTSTSQWGGNKTLMARWFDESGNQIQELGQPVTTGTNEYVSRLGDFLMVPMFSNEAFAIDLKNGTIALHATQENGSIYYNGCSNEDALYTLHENTSSKLVLTQYKIENGELVEKWHYTTRQENTGYDSFAFSLNEGKVLVYNKQRNGAPGMAIINPDGTKYQDKLEVNFGDYNEAWGYAATQTTDGKIYIFGMYAQGMTYGLSILTTDADLENPTGTIYDNLDPGYVLYYSQYDRSYFADNEFVFTGYMRPEEYNKFGYTTIFGTYSISDNEMQLLYKGDPGKISKVEPGMFTVDENYNVYATLTSNSKPMLVKYNSDGNQEWIKYIDSEGQLIKPVILSNGNICTGTRTNGIKIVCYTPEGEEVYNVTDTSVLNSLSYMASAYAIEGQENSLIVSGSGYNSSAQLSMPYIIKIDAEGHITSKLITDFAGTTNVNALTNDTEGNIYLLGNSSNSDDVPCPMILKVDNDLQVKKAFIQDIDVNCPLYNGAIDEEGRIFVVGNTWYHGMLFVYDKEFNLLGYHIFAQDMETQSVYQSLSLTSEGNALIAASYMDENYKNSGLVICYNDKAELLWQYNSSANGSNNHYYFYDAAQYGNNIIAVGYCNSIAGVQNYTLELNADHEILKECYAPQDKGYSSYSYRYSDIIGGNAYITFSYSLGQALFGNLTCFGNKTTGIGTTITTVESNGIVIKDGQARLANNSAAVWNVYTTDGRKVMNLNAAELNLNSLTRGMYIVSAKSGDKAYTIKVMR